MNESHHPTARSYRDLLNEGAPLLTLLVAYFFLTVLMNIVFVLYDDDSAIPSIADFSIDHFPIRTIGYWALLLLPFVVVPPIAILTRRMVGSRVATLVGAIPEFRLADYLVVVSICYAIIAFAMYRADAWRLFLQGSDAFSAVEARFALLERLRFLERAILQSLLVFLTIYSLVRAIVGRSLLWFALFAFNFVAMAVLLVLLNMKWPIVVLFGGVVTTTALFSKHRIIYSIIGIVGMVAVYLLIATIVLRIPQPDAPQSAQPISPGLTQPASPEASRPAAPQATGPAASGLPQATSRPPAVSLEAAVMAAKSSSPRLAVSGLIRMALPYPYYYRTFTNEGAVCGTLLGRLERRVSPCQPSMLIYERMFPNDQFASRGTSPAPFHVTGYALDGWLGAIIETVLTAIVVGIFMAVPANRSAVARAIVVMGVLTGYFFSQLPFEGPIVYDHGLLWWALLIVAYSLIRRVSVARHAQPA